MTALLCALLLAANHLVLSVTEEQCQKSKYGCCLDGETAAQGYKGEGCPSSEYPLTSICIWYCDYREICMLMLRSLRNLS